ncbi:MAG: flagellar basal body L-ring protein FlgH [Porticoccaceae bacterium]
MIRSGISTPGVALLAAVALLASGCTGVAHRGAAEESPPPAALPDYGPVNGAIYHRATARPLFEDVKARAVGDLLTVVLAENMNAKKSASTTTQKDSAISLPVPTLFGKSGSDLDFLNNEIDATRGFKGAGSSAQSNALTGTMTVAVVDVLPNGNLLVRGEKKVALNRGDEHIRISGIVRPADVSPANTIVSTRIADARITYAGTGELADSNAAGWLGRFFSSVIWPF